MEDTSLTTTQSTAVTEGTSAALALLQKANSSLDHAYEQMVAMTENNMGTSGGRESSYDFTGKVKVEVNKNGTLTFDNPFTGKIDGGANITIVPIEIKFQLQRWFGEKEEIEGIDKAKQKGPLCRSCQFEEPAGERAINETGWFFQPAMSAYNARRMLPTLTGSHGPDGKTGITLCSECPMSVQGFKGNEFGGKCGPIGMIEAVIFKVGDDFLQQPVYAYIKMTVTSIIEYVEFVKQIQKVHKDPITGKELLSPAMRMIVTLSCETMKGAVGTWGKLNFLPYGQVNPNTEQGTKILNDMAVAIELTTAKMNEAAEARKAAEANGGRAPAAAAGSTAVTKPNAPF